jgi:hypothetical protein
MGLWATAATIHRRRISPWDTPRRRPYSRPGSAAYGGRECCDLPTDPGELPLRAPGRTAPAWVTQSLMVHRVLPDSDSYRRLGMGMSPALAPLVGREAEVAHLLERWSRVKEGMDSPTSSSGSGTIPTKPNGRNWSMRCTNTVYRSARGARFSRHCSPSFCLTSTIRPCWKHRNYGGRRT